MPPRTIRTQRRRFFTRNAPSYDHGLLAVSLLVVIAGTYLFQPVLIGTGLIVIVYVGVRSIRQRGRKQQQAIAPPMIAVSDIPKPSPQSSDAPTDLGMLIEEMLSHERYALLLRSQIVANLTPLQHERTRTALNEAMSIIPAGEVMLARGNELLDEGRFTDGDHDRNRYARVSVEDFLLDRYPVTNRQYYQFVASGGYEQMSLWEPTILAAVLDFVDSTGAPGPRFWKDGRYPQGEDEYPVVGVSWYEAAAFARWIGKRLPTDAEWVKASSWPVPVSAGVWQQRKFPWGNAMERNRANVWGAGPGRTVPVDQFADGSSVGGVHQLVGNVWEWTTGDFGYDDLDGLLHSDLGDSASMKSLRGGAFDTYFETQATCHFGSGDHPLARKHNIGFRCALSACDVLRVPEPESEQGAGDISSHANEESSAALAEEVAV
jgi:gamma-glutamyl hercynylcysteine S-oxide synthase